MAFPQDRTAIRAEMAFGANLNAPPTSWDWTDVSGDLLDQQITITRGRANESSQASPTSCSLTLDNPHGHYTPGNPLSDHYPNVVQGTPFRASVQAGSAALLLDTNGGASTPDTAALDITGDLDVRIDAALDEWTKSASLELAGKYILTDDGRSWLLRIDTAGRIVFRWSTTGSDLTERASTEVIGSLVQSAHRIALRATLDVNNGAGGHTVTFYRAPTMAGPWTQVGDPVVSAGTTSVYNSTAPLDVGEVAGIGFATPTGRIYAFELRNGIDGPVLAGPDFTDVTPGVTSFVDIAGRTWTLNSTASISSWRRRFVGTVDEWSPTWPYGDLSHGDYAGEARVSITVSGTLRRLGQGQKALESTLRRRIPSRAPLAYWPLEEPAGATSAFSPAEVVGPLQVTGVSFGQDDSLAGSSALPTIEAGGRMVGSVPAPTAASTQWSVHMVYTLDGTPPASNGEFLAWRTSGTVRRWRILQRTGVGTIEGYNASGDLLVNQPVAVDDDDVLAGWNRYQFRVSETGGTVSWRLTWININGDAGGFGGTYSGTPGRVTQIDTQIGASVTGLRVGHIAVFPVELTDAYNFADHGFTGETAGTRMIRLASEEGVTFRFDGVADETATMGPQRPDTLLNLMRECESADGGVLADLRTDLGLQYRSRGTLYNQAVGLALDAQANEVSNPFAPVLDDQALRNDVQASRPAGSSSRVVDEASIAASGRYDEQITVNVSSDVQLDWIAGWRLHLGTWPGMRYPSVTTELAIAPNLIDAWLQIDIGDRSQVAGLPPQHPTDTVDSLLQGYSESISPTRWTVAAACSPAGPWTVGVVEDPVLGRADTDGTVLAAAVDASAASWPVTVTAGPDWITTATHPDQFPFDVTAGGEQVTVTAITGVAEDTFSRTVAAGWGTADSGQAWTLDGGSAADYAVSGGTGRLLLPAGTFRAAVASVSAPDVDLAVDYMLPVGPAGDSAYVYPVVRYAGGGDFYFARVQIGSTGVMSLTLRKRVGGAETLLASYATGMTHAPGTWYRVRLAVQGSALMARTWLRSTAEPTVWQVQATDTDLTAAESVGCRGYIGGSTTNSLPFSMQFDNLYVGPQQMTVTRSVNGIAKAHAAGASLSLTHPMRAAL
ncbi:hypothetical protein [Streptomyces sp. YPW6]|uniref:hypothetical protein n=1 Tax=Streptomyces sp. YPW6 TaxID=2840373 RepID=UPI003D7627D5